jgi:2,4-diaminopentanoate dehydrogenase
VYLQQAGQMEIATGVIIPAMPAVNAIASGVAPRPGNVTYADLPPVTSILRPKPAA